jgi:hypothetical protein
MLHTPYKLPGSFSLSTRFNRFCFMFYMLLEQATIFFLLMVISTLPLACSVKMLLALGFYYATESHMLREQLYTEVAGPFVHAKWA